MSTPFLQTKETEQSYAVEPSRSNDHHLYSTDATLPAPEGITEYATYGLAKVKDKRVLVGYLQFAIKGCTPNNGLIQDKTCNGGGIIFAAEDSLLSSRGMNALKEEDAGQCVGIGISTVWPYPAMPVSCNICIGKGQSLQSAIGASDEASSGAIHESPVDTTDRNVFHIALQFEDGSPARNAEWEATGSKGGKASGRLDDNGEACFTMDDESCTVTYPSVDSSVDARPEAQRDHALELVNELVRAGRSLGLETAVELLQYWRRGGDDLEGAERPDECWLDMFGRGRKGKRLPHTVFSRDHLAAVVAKLEDHRKKYVKATADRVNDGRLSHTTPFAEMKWEHNSDNWLSLSSIDLQFGFGSCTLYSKVRVRAIAPQALDDFAFDSWEVAIADRYDWEHGKTRAPGSMAIMNALHFIRYQRAENPQTVLHYLEDPYGFGDMHFKRVYARPFDIETTFFSIPCESASALYKPFTLE